MHNETSRPAAPSTPSWFRGDDTRQRARIAKALAKKPFATLATVSAAGHPHCAGVVFDAVGTTVYVHMMRESHKARNIASDGRIGVTVPVRTLPVGPPNTIHFQGDAEILDLDAPEIAALVEAGELKGISGHGALDEPGACFVRITPKGRINSYGIGVSVWALIRDPLHVGARSISA